MNRFAVAAVVLCFSFAGLAEEPECRNVQWTLGAHSVAGNGPVHELASVDYDEDGALDLVGAIDLFGTKLVWWKGVGDGSFARFAQTIYESRGEISNIVIADATGDGIPDVITHVNGYTQTFLILPGTGSGRGPALEKFLRRTMSGSVVTIAEIQLDADPAVELAVNFRNERLTGVYDDIAAGPRSVVFFPQIVIPAGVASADFDGDGNADVARALLAPPGLNIHFGNADGTFEAPLALAAVRPDQLVVGDLNEDGRPDLVASDQDATSHEAVASVYLNQGQRTFTHSAVPLARLGGSVRLGSMVLADFSGDGHLDLAGSVDQSRTVTAVGRGNGTFLTPTFLVEAAWQTNALAAGDFDRDGKLELAIGAEAARLYAARSTCATQVLLHSDSPTIAVGQEAALRAQVSGFGRDTPVPPGTVTLRNGTLILDSAPVSADGKASFVVPGLATGDFELTAEFSGNAALPAAVSSVLRHRVVSQPTNVVLTLPDEVVYGKPCPVQVQLIDVNWDWSVVLDIDGSRSKVHRWNLPVLALEPGSHTISATFPGGLDAPPGRSIPFPLTFTVSKADPVMIMKGPLDLREGYPLAFAFTVSGSGAIGPGGLVQLIEGTTTIASGALVNGAVTLEVVLSRGPHDVRAVYSGDTRYRDVTRNLPLAVLPNLLFPVEAQGMVDAIRIAYVLPPKAAESSLLLFRRRAGTPDWAVVPTWNRKTWMDTSVPLRGVDYEYRLLVSLHNGARIFSNIAAAKLPLQPRRRAVSP